MNYKKYEGQSLQEDEYLFKEYQGKGFLSKLTKKNEMPLAFKGWATNMKSFDKHSGSWINSPDPEIFVFKEVFNKGWKLQSWRFGQSQNWATLIHPAGFSLEIYLSQFLDIVKDNEIIKGEIIGEFKWQDHNLIKK